MGIPRKIALLLRNANLARLAACIMCMAFIVGTVGCGPKSDLLEVSGAVSLNGEPLKSGSIRFTLMNSEKALSREASIKDGQYSVDQTKGLSPGTYHILISAIDENSPMVTIRDAAGNPVTSAPADLIPAEFNTNSEKTVDVTSNGENHFVFDIVSK